MTKSEVTRMTRALGEAMMLPDRSSFVELSAPVIEEYRAMLTGDGSDYDRAVALYIARVETATDEDGFYSEDRVLPESEWINEHPQWTYGATLAEAQVNPQCVLEKASEDEFRQTYGVLPLTDTEWVEASEA